MDTKFIEFAIGILNVFVIGLAILIRRIKNIMKSKTTKSKQRKSNLRICKIAKRFYICKINKHFCHYQKGKSRD